MVVPFVSSSYTPPRTRHRPPAPLRAHGACTPTHVLLPSSFRLGGCDYHSNTFRRGGNANVFRSALSQQRRTFASDRPPGLTGGVHPTDQGLSALARRRLVRTSVGLAVLSSLSYVVGFGPAWGASMEPALPPSGTLVFYEAYPFLRPGARALEAGDFVTLISPHKTNVAWAKRIVATEGQQVRVQRRRLERADVIEETTVTVPKGMLWLEGDNPMSSFDSRVSGPVPGNLVFGRSLFVAIFDKTFPFVHLRLMPRRERVDLGLDVASEPPPEVENGSASRFVRTTRTSASEERERTTRSSTTSRE